MTVAFTSPPLELKVLLALTHHLPRVKGAGRLAMLLTRVYLRKPRSPVAASVLRLTMVLDPAEFVDRALLFYPQYWDPYELQFLRRSLHAGDVFLDIGAHVGLYSLLASKLVGQHGRVLAVEADPYTYARLCVNLRLNTARNVRAVAIGVSDGDTLLPLGINTHGNRAGNSFLFPQEKSVEVQCAPLLQIIQEGGLQHVTGAKLDVEGYEFRILQRFLEDADRRLWPEFLIVEFHPSWTEVAGGNVISLLTDAGYQIQARNCYGPDYENFTLTINTPPAD